jgi:hypothetical protein
MSLIVENLPKHVTVKQLHSIFSQAGSCSVDLISDDNKAIIYFSYATDARQAYDSYKDYNLNGNKLDITPIDIAKKSNKPKPKPKPKPEPKMIEKVETSPKLLKKKTNFRWNISHKAARKTAGYSHPINNNESEEEKSQDEKSEEDKIEDEKSDEDNEDEKSEDVKSDEEKCENKKNEEDKCEDEPEKKLKNNIVFY